MAAKKAPKKAAKKSAKKPASKKAPKRLTVKAVTPKGFGKPVFVGKVDLPKGFDPKKAKPEEFSKLIMDALNNSYDQGVFRCAEEVYKVLLQYPFPMALEAIELVYVAAIGQMGEVEQKALRAHLAQFHAELLMMRGVNSVEGTTTVQ